MRSYDPATLAALAAHRGVVRDMFWLEARNRDTGVWTGVGFWSGRRDRTITVVDGFTQASESRLFYGTNGLISISEVPYVADLSIRELRIGLAPLASEVIQILRTWSPKGGKFQLYSGIMDPDSRTFTEEPRSDFIGFIDRNPIAMGTGDRAEATLIVVSQTRELTRVSSATRSSEWLHTRDPDDDFYQYTADVPNWELQWGGTSGPVGQQSRAEMRRQRREDRRARWFGRSGG